MRKSAYERAPEFRISQADAYLWTESDSRGHVLAAWDRSDTALSTMRGITALTHHAAQEQLECSIDLDSSWFPTLILERAATSANNSYSGLNSLLRAHFIEAALRDGVSSVLGAVFDGAPRLRVLSELGYEFSLAKRMWDPNFVDHTPVHIVALARDRMPTALSTLRKRFGAVAECFPWRGPQLRLAQTTEVHDAESSSPA